MAEEQSSFLRRSTRRALAASGVTAAILYGWWQAVDNARTPPSLPEVQPGASLALGRVLLTPLSLELRPASTPKTPPQLVLTAIAENITGTTQVAAFGYPPRMVSAEASQLNLGTPDITLLRDRQPLYQLQPRMSEQVEISWKAPTDWQAGEALSLTFSRQQFKLKDNLYGRSNWLGFSPVARMTATPKVVP